MKTVEGDLIEMVLQRQFDVIGHGCNCFNKQKSGLAPQMAKAFGTDTYLLESPQFEGSHDKLGRIDYEWFMYDQNESVAVVNMYTQYRYGKNHSDGVVNPLDYEALTLCLRKLAYEFRDYRIGLPLIGGGLAGGDPVRIKEIMKQEMVDCDLTLVLYNK